MRNDETRNIWLPTLLVAAGTVLTSGCALEDVEDSSAIPSDRQINSSTPAPIPQASDERPHTESPASVSPPSSSVPGRPPLDTDTQRHLAPGTDSDLSDVNPPKDLVVHQTGLVSSVVTADGARLPGLHHRLDRLPPFAHRLDSKGVDADSLKSGTPHLPEPATSQLEFAATYFYSNKPRQIDVSVDLPDGYPTDWFPAADTHAPKSLDTCPCSDSELKSRGLDALADGRLDWTLQLADTASDRIDVPSEQLWDHLRQVPDASLVETSASKDSPETERFLGFSSIGTRKPPFSVTFEEDGYTDDVTFENHSDVQVGRMLLLDVHQEVGRVLRIQQVPPRDDRTFSPAPKEAPVPIETLAGQTRHHLTAMLEARGLSGQMARSTARAWVSGDLVEPGTRIIYLMPRSWADKLYPMTLQPNPDELVRALVGRVEILEPEDEQAAVNRVKTAYFNDTSLTELARGDRFAPPTFRRACQLIDTSQTARWCQREVAKLSRQVITQSVP